MVAEDLLASLNPAQRQVACTTSGPLLVLAGAGTGKTRCIIYRAGYLIASGIVPKENLLIVTFTNKAARELRERLEETFKLKTSSLWVGTFHSIFGRILRFEAKHLPFNSNYVIYDEKDQKSLIKKIFKKLNLDPRQFKPNAVRSVISNQKNNLITLDKFLDFNEYNPWTKRVFAVYKEYQQILEANNALDFDDILMHTAFLLADNPEVRRKWQNIFRYIMVDEYQDTNYAQFEIVKNLAKEHQNICVVGDDDQAIYSWRSATIKNILNFESDFANVKTIRLERNYRSHANILKLANSLIKSNKLRHSKELFTNLVKDQKPVLIALDSDTAEAEYVAEIISEQKTAYSDFAVLYRTNAQSRILEKTLMKRQIPYRIFGGVNFYLRKEVKDVLCFLKLVINPADQESLLRALSLQKGIGNTTIEKIFREAERQNFTPAVLLLNSDFCFLAARPAKLLTSFQLFWKKLISEGDSSSLHNLMMIILKDTPLGELYGIEQPKDLKGKKEFADPEAQSRYENLCELITAADEFSQEFITENDRQPLLAEYLATASLQTDLDTNDSSADAVNLMTLHNAKGLEFEHVIIIGLEEGLLPHHRSVEDSKSLEEERRLLYVGITRAKNNLLLTLARWRRSGYGVDTTKPSRFLSELDPQYINRQRYDPHAYLTPSRPPKKQPVNNFDVILESQKHFKIGQKIKHAILGSGIILSIDGKGRNARLIIKFDNGTIKKILGNYIELV